jgi:HlyD family secretion protein
VEAESSFTPYFALTRHDRGRLSFVAEVTLPDDGQRLPDGVPVEVTFGDAPAPGSQNE